MSTKYYALPNKLRDFRKEIGISQFEIAKMLNMEQTTYSKKEMGKNPISYESAIRISKIIRKNPKEFLENNISDGFFDNNRDEEDLINSSNHSLAEKLIKSLEDLISFVKENYKK